MHLPYAEACAAQVTVACVARRWRGVVEAEVAGVIGVIVMVRLQALLHFTDFGMLSGYATCTSVSQNFQTIQFHIVLLVQHYRYTVP